jgi:hypothetical protein
MTSGARKGVSDLTVWNATTTHLAPRHKTAKRMVDDLALSELLL